MIVLRTRGNLNMHILFPFCPLRAENIHWNEDVKRQHVSFPFVSSRTTTWLAQGNWGQNYFENFENFECESKIAKHKYCIRYSTLLVNFFDVLQSAQIVMEPANAASGAGMVTARPMLS